MRGKTSWQYQFGSKNEKKKLYQITPPILKVREDVEHMEWKRRTLSALRVTVQKEEGERKLVIPQRICDTKSAANTGGGCGNGSKTGC